MDQFPQEGLAVQVFQHIPETKIQMVFTFTQYQKSNTKPISKGTKLKPTLYSVSYIVSGKVTWIPESKKFLLVESGVLALRTRNSTQGMIGIWNPSPLTRNPESSTGSPESKTGLDNLTGVSDITNFTKFIKL